MKKIINGEDLKGMKLSIQEDGTIKICSSEQKDRFYPKEDERYYYLRNDGEFDFNYFRVKENFSKYIVDHNLVFKTIEECEEYQWFLDKLDEYKTNFTKEEWEDQNIEKYCLYYDHESNKISTYYEIFDEDMGVQYFTEENLKKLENVFLEEKLRLKKEFERL